MIRLYFWIKAFIGVAFAVVALTWVIIVLFAILAYKVKDSIEKRRRRRQREAQHDKFMNGWK